ncbi:MAG: VPLPA-CTERM sorting domain-containing protein [Gammaproteobacteria bacterium]|nr:VPLPA-CTERM sorting domain-containing protein [Gammaproteobacteria bacterium]
MTIKKIRASLAVGLAILLVAPASWGALVPYGQDFEALNIANPDALGFVGDGWGIFGIVYNGNPATPPNGDVKFDYGVFGAPNGGSGFSAIATGEAGAGQGTQYLNIYNDYNCCDLGAGDPPGSSAQGHGDNFAPFDRVRSIVLRDQTISAADIGQVWEFSFDAKNPSTNGCDAESTSTCGAFIKTLDPSAGFAETNFIYFDSRSLSNTDWTRHSISIDLSDAALEGQILQIGFESIAEQFGDTGVYYDNLSMSQVPVPAAVWLFGSALGLLGFVRRRLTS